MSFDEDLPLQRFSRSSVGTRSTSRVKWRAIPHNAEHVDWYRKLTKVLKRVNSLLAICTADLSNNNILLLLSQNHSQGYISLYVLCVKELFPITKSELQGIFLTFTQVKLCYVFYLPIVLTTCSSSPQSTKTLFAQFSKTFCLRAYKL